MIVFYTFIYFIQKVLSTLECEYTKYTKNNDYTKSNEYKSNNNSNQIKSDIKHKNTYEWNKIKDALSYLNHDQIINLKTQIDEFIKNKNISIKSSTIIRNKKFYINFDQPIEKILLDAYIFFNDNYHNINHQKKSLFTKYFIPNSFLNFFFNRKYLKSGEKRIIKKVTDEMKQNNIITFVDILTYNELMIESENILNYTENNSSKACQNFNTKKISDICLNLNELYLTIYILNNCNNTIKYVLNQKPLNNQILSYYELIIFYESFLGILNTNLIENNDTDEENIQFYEENNYMEKKDKTLEFNLNLCKTPIQILFYLLEQVVYNLSIKKEITEELDSFINNFIEHKKHKNKIKKLAKECNLKIKKTHYYMFN